jgi:hypothetical protein
MKRVGRLEKIIRRQLLDADGWPIHARDVLRRAYPGVSHYTWHHHALWVARRKFAVQLKRGVWVANAESRRRWWGE